MRILRLLYILLLLKCDFVFTQPEFELSRNVYRIPYASGIEVRVNRDHYTHSPARGRYDLKGFGNGGDCETNYPIVAAAEGIVRRIVDNHDVHGPDCTSDCSDFNNYVWIEHANGEWSKYTHFKKNSVTGNAGLKVGDTVCAGKFLGYECDIGQASGAHLHFEVRRPNDPNNVQISQAGGFMSDALHYIPVINSITKHYFEDGDEWTASGSSSCTTTSFAFLFAFTVTNGEMAVIMASNSISTQANVGVSFANGSNGMLHAGSVVTLAPGFTASAGSYFHARIGSCATTNFPGNCQ